MQRNESPESLHANRVPSSPEARTIEIYRPFAFPDEIRLLKLFPTEQQESLVGELAYVRLEDNPWYQAVSYTWADENGDVSMTGFLQLANISCTMTISRNCEAVLRRFRCENSTQWLWIDSVCINQTDLLECGHQVKIMPLVYSSASQVLVYLGDTFGNWCLGDFETLFAKLRYSFDPFKRLDDNNPQHRETSGATLLEKDQRAWEYFLGRRWFTRIWTLQEVLLAKSAIFFLGSVELDWQDLRAFDWPDYPKPAIFEMWDARLTGMSLEKALCIASRCYATRPHDKVYAILGLLDPAISHGIQPDYTKSCKRVFWEATVACMKTSRKASILSMIDASDRSRFSWVIDFSRPFFERLWYHTVGTMPEDWTLRLQASLRHKPQFWRTHQTRSALDLNEWPWANVDSAFWQIDHTSLRVRGILADTVIVPWKACNEAAEKLLKLANDRNYIRRQYERYQSGTRETHPFWEHRLLRMAQNVVFNTAEMQELADKLPRRFVGKWPHIGLPFSGLTQLVGDSHYDLDSIDLLAPAFELEEQVTRDERATYLLGTRMAEYLHLLSREDTIFFGEHSVGFGPKNVQVGDGVYNIEGVPTQMLLRRVPNGYQVIGRCSIASLVNVLAVFSALTLEKY